MAMVIKYRTPVPMKPKKIGRCCVCHPRKKAGRVFATDANFPRIGTCERCGTVQTFAACKITLTDAEIRGEGFKLNVIRK